MREILLLEDLSLLVIHCTPLRIYFAISDKLMRCNLTSRDRRNSRADFLFVLRKQKSAGLEFDLSFVGDENFREDKTNRKQNKGREAFFTR